MCGKKTSGRHHLMILALSRVEIKASEPSVKAAMENVKEKERKIQHPRKAVKKTKTQADIRHVFSDPSHGSRVGQGYQLLALPTLSKLRSSGKRSTTTPCQWMHMKGAVSKPDVALLQQTAVPLHLVTFRPFS